MEAETIFSFGSYYPPAPAIANQFWPISGSLEAPKEWLQFSPTLRSSEALRIWGRIAELPGGITSLRQRRSAYLGICEEELNQLKGTGEEPLLHVPYFYCSRAQALFFRLIAAQRMDSEEKKLQAEILNFLGMTLDYHRREYKALPAKQFPNSWSCWDKAIDEDDLGPDGRISKIQNLGSRTSQAAHAPCSGTSSYGARQRLGQASLGCGADAVLGRTGAAIENPLRETACSSSGVPLFAVGEDLLQDPPEGFLK